MATPVMLPPYREEIKMFPYVQSYITEVNVLVFTALYQAKFRYLLSPGMNFHPCPNWTPVPEPEPEHVTAEEL